MSLSLFKPRASPPHFELAYAQVLNSSAQGGRTRLCLENSNWKWLLHDADGIGTTYYLGTDTELPEELFLSLLFFVLKENQNQFHLFYLTLLSDV